MRGMGKGVLVPVEEYLTTVYRPDLEYIDGVLREREMGAYDHSRLQGLLYGYLLQREKQWRIRAVPEQRVQVKPSRFRVPDICVVIRDAPIEQIFTPPPVLCIEILSPEDRISEMQERIDDYLGFGVPCVWLLDPGPRRAWICKAGQMQDVRDGILRVPDLPIEVPLAELFD